MTSPLREQAAARIRAAAAQITAAADARLADIGSSGQAGGGRTRGRRAAERAARREVWAWRAAEIARVTAAIRAEVRLAEDVERRRRRQTQRAANQAERAQVRLTTQSRRDEDQSRRYETPAVSEAGLYQEQEMSL